MAENSNIEWTDHTFNPVMGCAKVSPGCSNCYAERDMDHRRGKVAWGPKGTRVKTSEANWKKPLKWDREADLQRRVFEAIRVTPMSHSELCDHGDLEGYGQVKLHNALDGLSDRGLASESIGTFTAVGRYQKPRVFCASLADVFEDWQGEIHDHQGARLSTCRNICGLITTKSHPSSKCALCNDELRPLTMDDIRRYLFRLIDAAPNLDWLLLTKRPENVVGMWMPRRDGGAANFPMNMNKHPDYRENVWIGTSVENQEFANKRVPELLPCADLSPVLFLSCEPLLGPVDLHEAQPAIPGSSDPTAPIPDGDNIGIDWVITGGESGPNARTAHSDWYRSLRDQCENAGVPFHFKQWGEWCPAEQTLVEILPKLWLDQEDSNGYLERHYRFGKKTAGRLLDGVEHNGVPEVRS